MRDGISDSGRRLLADQQKAILAIDDQLMDAREQLNETVKKSDLSPLLFQFQKEEQKEMTRERSASFCCGKANGEPGRNREHGTEGYEYGMEAARGVRAGDGSGAGRDGLAGDDDGGKGIC